MNLVDKYLNESKEDDERIKGMLKGANPKTVQELKYRYYGIVDNMDRLVKALAAADHETGEFSADLKLAKQMQKLFDKMMTGRYV